MSAQTLPFPEPVGRRLVRDILSRFLPDPDQVRREFIQAKLEELAGSLRINGQQIPIIVRPHPSRAGFYIIVDGHRRHRAAGLAGLEELEALVVSETLDEAGLLTIQLTLGLTSEKLNPFDQMDGVQRLMKAKGFTTQDEAAHEIGISPAKLSKLMTLSANGSPALRVAVEAGFPISIAATIARVEDHAKQDELLTEAKAKKLTIGPVTTRVQQLVSTGKPKAKPIPVKTKAGVSLQLPPIPLDALIGELSKVIEGLRQLGKQKLPLSVLPNILES